MRKSLPKTPHSAPSSRVAHLPSALLAVAGAPGRLKRAARANGEASRPIAIDDVRTPVLAARLRLLEGFLSRTEVADAAQYGLQWLGEVLGVRQSVCLIKPSAESSLFTVASNGFASSATSSFVVPLEDWDNPLIQALKTDLLRAEAKLQELSTRLGPAHPQYQQQASEIAALRAKMNAEISRVVAGVQNVTAQNRARQASLQAALDQQRKRVIDMRDARNEAFILQRDVETAQKAYEATLARYMVNKVEAGARQTNVSILNPAVEPSWPAKPKRLLNIALGIVMGLVLGLAAVFLLELLDRRVRSGADLEAGLDAPLLGTLQPWHPSRLLGTSQGGHKALPSPAA